MGRAALGEAPRLAGRLRQAGIRNTGEVAMAVLEPSGTISVIRRGEPVSPFLLDGVDGAELVPDKLRAGTSG